MKPWRGCIVHCPVSILVVLDWVFKQCTSAGSSLTKPRFNPCCIGLGIQTLVDGCEARRADWVSILVVLDWVFKPYESGGKLYNVLEFQSLLYWIGYSNNQGIAVGPEPRLGFNPCCIGLGIQTPSAEGHRRIHRVSILVVLDWVFKLWGFTFQVDKG